eukprot:545235_1
MYERAESVLNLTMINKYKDKMYLHDVKLSTILLNSLHAILVNHLTPLDIYINVDPSGCWSCNDAVNEYQTKYYASNILICAENDTLLHVSCGSIVSRTEFVKKQLKVALKDEMCLEMQINNLAKYMFLLMHTINKSIIQSRPLAGSVQFNFRIIPQSTKPTTPKKNICDYINMFCDAYENADDDSANEINYTSHKSFLKTPKHKKKNYRKRKSKFRYSKNGKLSYKTYRNNKKKKIGRAH